MYVPLYISINGPMLGIIIFIITKIIMKNIYVYQKYEKKILYHENILYLLIYKTLIPKKNWICWSKFVRMYVIIFL